MALMSGEIDAVTDVGAILPQQADMFQGKDIVLKQVEVATTHYLIFNCSTPPFHKADHRHWLAGQMDLPGMIKALVPGAAQPARDPYTPLARDWTFHLLPLYHDISYYAHTRRIDNFFLDHHFRPGLTQTRIRK